MNLTLNQAPGPLIPTMNAFGLYLETRAAKLMHKVVEAQRHMRISISTERLIQEYSGRDLKDLLQYERLYLLRKFVVNVTS
jgi:hypothetical protein